ncbi:MAG: TraB/GumN family protein [Paracoccus sp. (in: a-proteobacteria)]|nr:TraB/GumN family protein [Paracoccus sp. (in: a-proteobacteria)]
MKTWIFAALLAALPLGAAAECVGRNLMADFTEDERAALDAAADRVPFARGIFWTASRGEAQIYLVGTYHFDDPRHDQIVAKAGPRIQEAAALLVEAGPDEQARLQDEMIRNPGLLIQTEGPNLRELLEDDEWELLTAAMAERGMPGVMLAQLRPWYVATMLGLSPCMIAQVQRDGFDGGLDQRLMGTAQDAGVPVAALEEWDTVLTVFGGLSPEDEARLIRSALPGAAHADDYGFTLAEGYFDGDIWALWETGRILAERDGDFSTEEIDEQMALVQDLLMDRRNRDWIIPLTEAAESAAQDGAHIVAAFGALHLPGEGGVLNLLQEDGWTIEPWE